MSSRKIAIMQLQCYAPLGSGTRHKCSSSTPQSICRMVYTSQAYYRRGGRMQKTICVVLLSTLLSVAAFAQKAADRKDWVQIFNGKNLDGWTAKINGYEPGDNYADTF